MSSRTFEVIVYNEEDLIKLINYSQLNNVDYAYVMHDKDINNDTGELKKLHYHFILY